MEPGAGVIRTLARTAAIGALVFALAAVIVGTVILATRGEQIDPGTIVVVGDPTAPGMQDVIHELQDRAASSDELRTSGKANAGTFAIAALVFLWLGVGAVIVWRQPSNWAGWLFLITGLPVPVTWIAGAIVINNLKEGGSLPFTGLFAWAGEFALYPIALIPLLFLLYPDGHAPGRRWRWSVVGLVGGTFVAFLGFLLRPGP